MNCSINYFSKCTSCLPQGYLKITSRLPQGYLKVYNKGELRGNQRVL